MTPIEGGTETAFSHSIKNQNLTFWLRKRVGGGGGGGGLSD